MTAIFKKTFLKLEASALQYCNARFSVKFIIGSATLKYLANFKNKL